jgi:hypothetical protein
MDDEREEEQGGESKPGKSRGRTWLQRHAGPIRFSRITSRDGLGRMRVILKFELAGESKLPPAVYEVLKEAKYIERDADHGGGSFPSGLEFGRIPGHGRVWHLANDQKGRYVADLLCERLEDLARKIEDDQTKVR